MPLVLVHNELVRNPDHLWDDVEGERYHYPSKYQGKIRTGEPFVYYRGVWRADGKRGAAEYLGSGRIGAIWVDPARPEGRNKAWYCAIEDYRRFAEPVPAKVDGAFIEDIPANLWRDGVRTLTREDYLKIVGFAATQPALEEACPAAEAAEIVASSALIMPSAPAGVRTGRSGYRKSKRAKAVGDWAELIAVRYIQETVLGCSSCVHRAQQGETPGWDIDYLDAEGVLQRVEVKGTISGAFDGFDLSAGEMRAAKAYGDTYWLYLVASCLTKTPKVQAIRNPAAKLLSGHWLASPSVYAVRFG